MELIDTARPDGNRGQPDELSVIKLNLEGDETWRYPARVLEKAENFILVEAFFNRPDTPVEEIILKKGDRFVESYYTDRWYNIYEIFDGENGSFKAWYCNITYPAEISQNQVAYVDLALDLLVYPDKTMVVLDEDEFAEMPISEQDREQASQALEDLKKRFR